MEHTAPEEIVWFGVAAVPLIIALVEVAKRTFHMDSRFAAIVAVALGLVGGLVLHLSHSSSHTVYEAMFGGLIAGLAASGLYSGTKAIRSG